MCRGARTTLLWPSCFLARSGDCVNSLGPPSLLPLFRSRDAFVDKDAEDGASLLDQNSFPDPTSGSQRLQIQDSRFPRRKAYFYRSVEVPATVRELSQLLTERVDVAEGPDTHRSEPLDQEVSPGFVRAGVSETFENELCGGRV